MGDVKTRLKANIELMRCDIENEDEVLETIQFSCDVVEMDQDMGGLLLLIELTSPVEFS